MAQVQPGVPCYATHATHATHAQVEGQYEDWMEVLRLLYHGGGCGWAHAHGTNGLDRADMLVGFKIWPKPDKL